jgi:hypothetical protein
MRLIFLLTTSLLGGCGIYTFYDGPRLGENFAVRISGVDDPAAAGYSVAICKIDDRELSPCRRQVELRPGRYTLKIVDEGPDGTPDHAWISRTFNAGDRYILDLDGVQPTIRFGENVNE